MRIQHNIMAMNAYRNFGNNTSALSKNLEKLSSGYKINRAGDDAAGLAISEKMRAQITGLKAATKNVKDGISLVKTAEGALQEVHDMLNRMDYLATQSANGTYDNAVDRANLQKEVDSLKKEINRISDSANFNGQKLLNGELSNDTITTFKDDGTNVGTNAAIDLTFTAGKWIKADGTEVAAPAITIKHGAGGNKAEIKNDGTGIEITVDVSKAGTDYTSDDIKALLAKATVANGGNLSNEDKASLQEWAKNITVSGKGITGEANGNGVAAATSTKTFNGKPMQLQIGDTSQKYDQLSVKVGDLDTKGLGIDDLDISTPEGASAAIDKIKAAINTVSSTRGDLGAIQNRLEHTQNNLSVMTENIQDAESTIRDTDVPRK